MDALELFRAGKLDEAIQAAVAGVKQAPNKPEQRDLLAQLLCFAGEFERAESHLKTLQIQFPDREQAILLLQNLVSAAQARQKFFDGGWLPQFLENPPDYLKLHLEASVELREGRPESAKQILERAEEMRPAVAGKCDGHNFEDMRDFDDLTAPFLEVLTSHGTYYWVPFERIRRLALLHMESPIDVLWRAARMDVSDELQGVVYVPQLYIDSASSADEEIRLGKATEWKSNEGEPVRGLGHRVLWLSGEARPMAQISEMSFKRPS